MRWLCWWRPPFHLRSVILNLTSNDAISGVLWSTRAGWYTLRNASALKAGQQPVTIDGEACIHRDQIVFVQVLP